jgi:hypothetical protein
MTTGAVQTTNVQAPDPGVPGMLYDAAEADIVSMIARGPIPFGAYVGPTASGGCALPAAADDISGGGIALAAPAHATGTGYVLGDAVNVLRRGRVWVTTEGAVTGQTAPFIRYTPSGALTAGGLAGAVDTGKNVAAKGANFYRGNGTAGLAVLELNYPGA